MGAFIGVSSDCCEALTPLLLGPVVDFGAGAMDKPALLLTVITFCVCLGAGSSSGPVILAAVGTCRRYNVLGDHNALESCQAKANTPQ